MSSGASPRRWQVVPPNVKVSSLPESLILHFLVRALDAELLTGGTGFHDCALIFFKASSMCGGINFLPDSSAFSCFCSLTICCAV